MAERGQDSRVRLALLLAEAVAPGGKCALNMALALLRLSLYDLRVAAALFPTLRRKVHLVDRYDKAVLPELLRIAAQHHPGTTARSGAHVLPAAEARVLEWVRGLQRTGGPARKRAREGASSAPAGGGGGAAGAGVGAGGGDGSATTGAVSPKRHRRANEPRAAGAVPAGGGGGGGGRAAAAAGWGRFSELPVWAKTEQYYAAQGVRSFSRGPVPFQISSTRYVARCYAELITNWRRDQGHGQTDPITIVEAGSGPCQFALHLARILQESSPGLDFHVVLTDLPGMLACRASHPAFGQLTRAGRVSFAPFSGTASSAATLAEHLARAHPSPAPRRHRPPRPVGATDDSAVSNSDPNADAKARRAGAASGGQDAGPGAATNLVVIGNYLFDSLPGDIFERTAHEGEVREVLCRPRMGRPARATHGRGEGRAEQGTGQGAVAAAAAAGFSEVEVRVDFQAPAARAVPVGQVYPGDAVRTRALRRMVSGSTIPCNGRFLFPTAGVAMVHDLLGATKPRGALLLVGDKSYAHGDFCDRAPPGKCVRARAREPRAAASPVRDAFCLEPAWPL